MYKHLYYCYHLLIMNCPVLSEQLFQQPEGRIIREVICSESKKTSVAEAALSISSSKADCVALQNHNHQGS